MLADWRDVPGSPGYEVSSNGVVRTKPRTLKVWKLPKGGHLAIALGGKRRDYVHRLVALAFLGPAPHDKPWVNHKDGNPENNDVANLEWASPSENVRHGYRSNGRKAWQSRPVIGIDSAGGTVQYESGAAAARAHGVDKTAICSAVRRGGTSAGYRWRRA